MTEGPHEADNVVAFPQPHTMDPHELEDALWAMLFATGEPVQASALAEALQEVDVSTVRQSLLALALRDTGGIRVVEVAGGWQLRSALQYAEPIRRLRGGRPVQMSRAVLEVLAITAYRQPVTRAEIDTLRGVKSGNLLKQLLEKGYLRVSGRREEPGRPLEYATTPYFLEMFELKSLADLPTIEDREAMLDAEGDVPASLGTLLRDESTEE